MINHSNIVSRISKSGYIVVLLSIFVLSSCAATQGKESAANTGSDKAEQTTQTDAANSEQAKQEETATAEPTGKEEAEIKEGPLHVVVSCKDEPYVKYENASLASMKKGLAATKQKEYGVGFRSIDEYKRWSGIHDKLFAKVNESCATLKQCVKENPKDKNKKCANDASVFNEWQDMAKRFATRVKMVETTELDEICSFEPNLEDAPQCFHALGDNVDKVCNSAQCKDLGNCWRDVGYLDEAMKQADLACHFVKKTLSDCGAYTLAKSRREKKFAACKELQSEVDIVRFPPL